MKIHILGASGSGTTTLGIKLAKSLNISHFDSDDFFWEKTDPPFTKQTEIPIRLLKLISTLSEYDSWILSGSIMDWGNILIPEFDYVVFVFLNNEIRMKRLLIREKERYGSRINNGNDMFNTHNEFMNWASKYDIAGLEIRSLISHTEWLKKIKCPVIKIENVYDIDDEVEFVIKSINA
jgi:adenylate kinase family enzyme